MGLKIDLHVHTRYSPDSSITLDDVVAFAKRRGLDGVAVTDHNTVEGAQKLKTSDIIVIPGIEVSTLNGHLLGLNVDVPIPAKRGIEETVNLIHEAGGIAVAPHPFSFYKSPPSRNVTCYDAVEVMNAASVPFSVLTHYSKRFAERLGLPQTGGSDAHYAPEIGSAYTVVESGPDVDEIVSTIKKGAVFAVGNGVPLRIRFGRMYSRFKKKA